MDILYEHEAWNKLLKAPGLHKLWGDMEGRQLKTAPRDFPKDHPAIGLLRHTQFIFRRNFSNKEVLAADFVDEVDRSFQALRPWLDHLSEVLTSDGNGGQLR
jgi:uncharacterized protein (DUF2461 family)